jgi:hypothetical protein
VSSAGSGRPFRPIDGPTKGLRILLIVGILGDVTSIVVTILELRTLERFRQGLASGTEANDAIHRSGVVGIGTVVIFLGTVIVWLVWQHRAQSNLHALGIERLRFTPGWAVGWWLIPIANLWKPFQTMRELWKASGGDEHWWTSRTWSVIGWWWAGYVVFNVLDNIAGRSFASDSPSVETFILGDRVSVVADLGSVATALLAIALIRSVAARQAQLPDRLADRSPIPTRPDLPPGTAERTP